MTGGTSSNTQISPVPSRPGFGYLFTSMPYLAEFQEVGEYFYISYLPKGFPDNIEQLKACLWLGPEYAQDEMITFLIWPGRGIRSFGAALTSKEPSRLVDLGMETGSFEHHAPNTIIHELLNINLKPCVHFIKWPTLPTLVTDSALQLSFSTLAHNWVNDLSQFLEDVDMNFGDTIPASSIQEWYSRILKKLREADPKLYLFDPTIFLARLLIHLRSTLQTVNHFDINAATKSGGPIFIPLCFIRSWKKEFLSELNKDSTFLREFIAN